MTDNKIMKNTSKIYRINLQIIMEETYLDFPTKNWKSEKKITQLRQVLKSNTYTCTFTAPKFTLLNYAKDIAVIYV